MRIDITNRSNVTLYSMQDAKEQFSNLTYETIISGGMSVATVRLPYDISIKRQRLLGNRLIIYDKSQPTWWGTISDVTDRVTGGDSSIELRVYGPWEMMSRIPFTQAYKGYSYTGNDVIYAALFGNVPDVAMTSDNWDSLSLSLIPVTWSNSNVQTVITECCRFGDTTTSPWSFIVLPPRTSHPANAGVFEMNTGMDDITYWVTYGTAPTIQGDIFQRGQAMSCWHDYNPAGATSYVQRNFASTSTDAYVSAWIRMPSDMQPINYGLLSLYDTNGTNIAMMFIDGTGVISIQNVPANTTHTGYSVVLGKGCWHHIILYCHRNATTGSVKGYFDGGLIIDVSSLNLGALDIHGVAVGLMDSCTTTGRGIDMDSLWAKTGATLPSQLYYRFESETLPIPYLFKINTTTYDIDLNLADISDISLTESLNGVANQVIVEYASGSQSYIHTDALSISRYGQQPSVPSLTKTSSSALANYYAARYLQQYKEPRMKLSPFTLTIPPMQKNGSPLPLSQIRAGLRFRIRERPDIGNVYIAHTRWTQASSGQSERVEITPNEPPTDIATLVALTTAKGWT